MDTTTVFSSLQIESEERRVASWGCFPH